MKTQEIEAWHVTSVMFSSTSGTWKPNSAAFPTREKAEEYLIRCSAYSFMACFEIVGPLKQRAPLAPATDPCPPSGNPEEELAWWDRQHQQRTSH